MPGFTFPTVGPLCLSSPPTRYGCILASRTTGTMIRCDCQSPFSELFFPFFSDTLQAPALVCVPSLSARWTGWKLSHPPPGLWFSVSTPHLLTDDKEAIGSPKFPSYPRKYMPRSKTPVVSCTLASIVSRTAAFRSLHTVGFPSLTRVYPLTTIIPISRLNSAACTLVPLSSVLPLLGLHVRFPTGLLVRL